MLEDRNDPYLPFTDLVNKKSNISHDQFWCYDLRLNYTFQWKLYDSITFLYFKLSYIDIYTKLWKELFV